MRFLPASLACFLFLIPTTQGLPPALAEMVEAERRFSRTAAERGTREAFLAFFADDAVGFEPTPGPAKAQISKWPDQPPGVVLSWEPRAGDIAASGDLGFLTGPARRVAPGRPDFHLCYASVWKRQPDGSFKVVVDFGVTTPERPDFAEGVVRLWDAPRYEGRESAATATESLRAADRNLVSQTRTRPLAQAYEGVVAQRPLFLRDGVQPIAGRPAVATWLAGRLPLAASEQRYAEAAASGDIGYTWGSYATEPQPDAKPERGYYVRYWGRDERGAWRLLVDIARATRS